MLRCLYENESFLTSARAAARLISCPIPASPRGTDLPPPSTECRAKGSVQVEAVDEGDQNGALVNESSCPCRLVCCQLLLPALIVVMIKTLKAFVSGSLATWPAHKAVYGISYAGSSCILAGEGLQPRGIKAPHSCQQLVGCSTHLHGHTRGKWGPMALAATQQRHSCCQGSSGFATTALVSCTLPAALRPPTNQPTHCTPAHQCVQCCQVVTQLCLVVVHQQRVGHNYQGLLCSQGLKDAARTCGVDVDKRSTTARNASLVQAINIGRMHH